MLNTLAGAPPAAFLLYGLTIVCVASTVMLIGVFAFLFFAERSLKKTDIKT